VGVERNGLAGVTWVVSHPPHAPTCLGARKRRRRRGCSRALTLHQGRVSCFGAVAERDLGPMLAAAVERVIAARAELDLALRVLTEMHLQTGFSAEQEGAKRHDAARLMRDDLRFTGMTVAETAGALDLSEEHVRRLLRRGDLRGVSFGGRIGWRLPRDYVEELANEAAAATERHAEARRARLIRGRGRKRE
jgi:excisionase family DNA binding protein